VDPMTVSPVLLRHRLAVGSLRRELGRARGQAAAQGRSGVTVLAGVHHYPGALVVLALWVAGIAVDAWTTVAMMNTGLFEEANPLAAYGMRWIGMGGWVALASLACAVMAIASLGRSKGVYARTLLVVCLVIGAAKVCAALRNYLLWTSGTG
jgi:Domain of unknown function (DUF5658)